jgi:hypothetical protein
MERLKHLYAEIQNIIAEGEGTKLYLNPDEGLQFGGFASRYKNGRLKTLNQLAAPETYAHVSELFAGMKSLSIKRTVDSPVVIPHAPETTRKMSFAQTIGNAQLYAVFNQATNQSRTTTMAHQLPSGEQRVTTNTAAVLTHVTV